MQAQVNKDMASCGAGGKYIIAAPKLQRGDQQRAVALGLS